MPVDIQSAGSADALATIVVEGDWVFAFQNQLLIENIEHLKERGFSRDIIQLIFNEFTF